MDPEMLSETLEALSSRGAQRARGKHVHTLRGIRGVPDGEVARVLAAAWYEDPPHLPVDAGDLRQLYGTAFEDGLVAIGLLAATVPDTPREALEEGLDWLDRVDETATSDALGTLVLGPAALVTGALDELLAETMRHGRAEVRRAGAIAALAFLPVPIQGPAAAALRERVGERRVQHVAEAHSDVIAGWLDAFLRDESPLVRKALRRVLREWSGADPEAVVAWADTVHGGLPKILKAEVDRAARRARR